MGILRLLLALSVAQGHAYSLLLLPDALYGTHWIGGTRAVQVFYMVSGFYMTLILNGKYPSTAAGRWLFWSNRALRLYPTYAAVVLLTLCFHEVHWPACRDGVRLFFVAVNALIFGQDLTYFLNVSSSGSLQWAPFLNSPGTPGWNFLLVPQAWTMGLEGMFYLCAPWLVRTGTRVRMGWVVGSLLVRLVLWSAGFREPPWSFRFFPSELVFFLMGSLGCSYRDRINSWPKVPVRAAVVATLLAIFILNERMDFSIWLWPTVVFLCFGLAVPVLFEWTRNNPLDLWLGHLSYPLYLGHLGVLWWMSKHPDLLRQMFWGHVGVIASLVLAVLLHVLIERPIDTWRQRRLKR